MWKAARHQCQVQNEQDQTQIGHHCRRRTITNRWLGISVLTDEIASLIIAQLRAATGMQEHIPTSTYLPDSKDNHQCSKNFSNANKKSRNIRYWHTSLGIITYYEFQCEWKFGLTTMYTWLNCCQIILWTTRKSIWFKLRHLKFHQVVWNNEFQSIHPMTAAFDIFFVHCKITRILFKLNRYNYNICAMSKQFSYYMTLGLVIQKCLMCTE